MCYGARLCRLVQKKTILMDTCWQLFACNVRFISTLWVCVRRHLARLHHFSKHIQIIGPYAIGKIGCNISMWFFPLFISDCIVLLCIRGSRRIHCHARVLNDTFVARMPCTLNSICFNCTHLLCNTIFKCEKKIEIVDSDWMKTCFKLSSQLQPII